MDAGPRRPNRLTGVRLASRQRHHQAVRTGAVIAGIAAAAAAFALLCMNASAPTVHLAGVLPAASQVRAYDILVRQPSRVAGRDAAGAPVRPADLAELAGGITLAQYDTIAALPGVQVAAPMTMVGYVPLTVVIGVPVPLAAVTAPARYTLSAREVSDDGLSRTEVANAGSTYLTAGPACPRAAAAPRGPAAAGRPGSDPPPVAACWSAATGADPATWPGPAPARLSVPFERTFWLPLVAVDPAAEATLLHLDKAVTAGSYLPEGGGAGQGGVPVIIASSVADDETDQLTITRQPASGSGPAAPAGTGTVTAGQAYQALVTQLRGTAAAPVPAYWTPSRATYRTSASGALVPQPVAGGGFRALTPHRARTSPAAAGTGAARPAGARLHAVGVFDPAMVASSSATSSPYLGEQLAGADTRSQWLLSGAALGPDGNPAGYPSPGATLVMPLADIGELTSPAAYTGTDARAPIGSVRVRVAGATGDDALSRERARVVAQEIVRATGLHVVLTLAATAAVRTIDLPAGPGGRPALHLSEVWYRTDTPATVAAALDPRSVALAAAVLVMGGALAASDVMARLRRRRRELATLRALGWPRRRLAWRFAREFGVIAAVAGALAALTVALAGSALTGRLAVGWPLLSMCAAAVMVLAAAGWQVHRAIGPAMPPPGRTAARPGRARRAGQLGHAVGSLRRARARTALRIVVITVACAVLGAEIAVRWLFGGVVVGSWLGGTVSWQQQPIDAAAVIIVCALAVLASADIGWRNGADRLAESRTLRAIGWPSRELARLAAGEAVLVGLTGGTLAAAMDVAGIAALVPRPPAGLALVALIAAAAGAVISLTAAALSAAAQSAGRADSV